jgi:glycosyltransferase involved in cell wall biosynthesis
MEGGANVLSEAIVVGVPVLASRIDGNIGILGETYLGFFRVGDTSELRQLMLRVETDRRFLLGLQKAIIGLASLFDPDRERRAWIRLIADVAG